MFFVLCFKCFSIQTEASSMAVSVIYGIPQIIAFKRYYYVWSLGL